MDFQKGRHYDYALEMAIIGACMLESDAVDKIYGLIQSKHFYDEKNQFLLKRIFMMKTNHQAIDLLTVTFGAGVNMKEWNKISPTINLPAYASLTMNAVVSTAHMQEHCRQLHQLFVNRKALEIQMNVGKNPDGVEAMYLLKKEIDELFVDVTLDDFDEGDDGIVQDLFPHIDERKDKPMIGLPTGFARITEAIGGLQNGHLIVVGARPSVGKTAFAETIALAASKFVPVGINLLEMPKKEYLARLLAQKTDFTFKQIWENKMTDDEYKTFMQQAYLGGKIYINSNIYITMTGIESGAMRLKEKYNLGLLIIDYLQLITSEIKGKEENREREVSKISRRCKQLAMDLDIPVVLLAQLNRASELTGDKKPRLHNLRESGAIEQDADDVILLHRDREKEKILIRSGQTKDLPAFAMVEKARNGHCNDYDLLFNGPKMLFTEPPEDIRQPAQLTIVGLPKIELPASKNWYEKDDDDNGFDDGFNEEQLF